MPARDAHDRRIVLLGASNVTRAVSTVVQTARLTVGGPARVLAAIGHGRSYGRPSTVCGRTLPGIIESPLWSELGGPGPPTYALMTDIGNDIAYGFDPATISGWLEQCLDRLAELDARIVITGLPLESLGRLGPVRFKLAKTLLFPGRPIDLDEARARALAVDAAVRRMAGHYDATVIDLPGRWYGLDPIHIRMRHWPETWASILRVWTGGTPARARGSLWRWLMLRTAFPRRWRLLGVDIERPQPSRTLPDGTTVSFY